jgi:hypothetical protein
MFMASSSEAHTAHKWPILVSIFRLVWYGVFMAKTDPQAETYTDAETEARREAALKRMLATPHKPHKTMGPNKGTRKRTG